MKKSFAKQLTADFLKSIGKEEKPQKAKDKNIMKAERVKTQDIFNNDNNFTKDQFKRFLNGDFTKEDTNNNLHITDNLRIEFDPTNKIFKLFYMKKTSKSDYFEIFGSFKDVIKIKRTIYRIKTTIQTEKTEVIKLTNIKGKKEEDTIREFNLYESKVVNLGQFVKFGNQKEQDLFYAYQDFYIFLNSSIIPTREEFLTDCYGVFSKDVVLLPNKYNLLNDIEKQEELIMYEENYREELQDQTELKKIGLELRKYLSMSYTSQILFSYSLISPFRYYLMGKGLSEFSFLGLGGKSGSGKTTRNKILFNKFHSNYNSEGYTESSLNSSFRILKLQNQNTPLVIDDPKHIDNRILSLLKSFATSKLTTDFRGTQDQKTIKYHIIRPIVLSFNRMRITEIELIKRFIIIDSTGDKLKEHERKPKEDLIKYVDSNIYLLGRFYYDNINKFIDILNNTDYKESRINSKETILNLGFKLLNEFFAMLDIKPLEEFNMIDYVEDGTKYIYNDNDSLQAELIEQLIRLTQTSIKVLKGDNLSIINYNIYHILDNGIDKPIRADIENRCNIMGIYIHNNNFLLTRETLKHLRIKDLKLNKITDLKQIFTEEQYEIIGTGQKTQNIKYGETTKTGFLIINNLETEDKRQKDNDLSQYKETETQKAERLGKEIQQKINNMENEK
jgi:hypothetical protein